MVFEFDATKSQANQAKHGLDFSEAQKLWQDVDAVELSARSDVEIRLILVARLENRTWAAVYTERGDRIRIISVRPARTNEKAIYDQTENDCAES